jgi:hypothetical protein
VRIGYAIPYRMSSPLFKQLPKVIWTAAGPLPSAYHRLFIVSVTIKKVWRLSRGKRARSFTSWLAHNELTLTHQIQFKGVPQILSDIGLRFAEVVDLTFIFTVNTLRVNQDSTTKRVGDDFVDRTVVADDFAVVDLFIHCGYTLVVSYVNVKRLVDKSGRSVLKSKHWVGITV